MSNRYENESLTSYIGILRVNSYTAAKTASSKEKLTPDSDGPQPHSTLKIASFFRCEAPFKMWGQKRTFPNQ